MQNLNFGFASRLFLGYNNTGADHGDRPSRITPLSSMFYTCVCTLSLSAQRTLYWGFRIGRVLFSGISCSIPLVYLRLYISWNRWAYFNSTCSISCLSFTGRWSNLPCSNFLYRSSFLFFFCLLFSGSDVGGPLVNSVYQFLGYFFGHAENCIAFGIINCSSLKLATITIAWLFLLLVISSLCYDVTGGGRSPLF